jgi:transcriptional regulator with XRE-family HTH domain
MDWNRIVAGNLRRLRLERKLTQEQLGHEAGIDLTYVGRIERNQKNPTVDVIGRLAAALGVHPSAFFHEI